MSKKQIPIALLLATTMLLPTLASCGGASTSSAGGTVKMVLWPGPEGDAMKAVVEEYNAGQGRKDGVQVELVLLSRSDTFTKEATEMAAKSSNFDAYFTSSYSIDQHAPYLEPLDINTDPFFSEAVDSMTIDGEVMGLPLDASMHGLFYREDLMADLLNNQSAREEFAAISANVLGERLVPKDPADWDWHDFLATAAYFTRKYNPDSATEYGTQIAAKNTPFNVMYWNDVLWSLGGNWTDGDKPSLDSEAAQDAMEIYQTAFDRELVPASSSQAEYPELQASMQSESVAFIHQWTAGYSSLNSPTESPEIAGKIGIAPSPGDQAHVHFLGVGINKYSQNKAATEKWFDYLATEDAQETYADAGGVPSVPSVLKAVSADNEILGYVAEWVEDYGFVEPRLPGASQYQLFVALGDALSGSWANNESAEAGLAEGQDSLEEYTD